MNKNCNPNPHNLNKTPLKASKANQEEEKSPSFDESKKKFINQIWNLIPRKLHKPALILLLILVLLGGLASTQSMWLPIVKSILNKQQLRENFNFGGYIYIERNKPFKTEVRLLNGKGKNIANSSSDESGYVTFNIPSDIIIGEIQCRDNNGWISLAIKDYKLFKKKGSFKLYLKDKRIEIP